MKIIKEFKEFAVKGNVVDLAVGVIIGGAFGKIVSSLVNDIIMPPLGILAGGINFQDLFFTLKTASENSPAVVLSYGKFLQTSVDFLVVAFVIFLMVKVMNHLRRMEEPQQKLLSKIPKGEKLLSEIRDLLKKKS